MKITIELINDLKAGVHVLEATVVPPIVVDPPPPPPPPPTGLTAKFSAVVTGATVVFTDASTGDFANPTSMKNGRYQWNFGDGRIIYAPPGNQTYAYTKPKGTYTVTLLVIDATGKIAKFTQDVTTTEDGVAPAPAPAPGPAPPPSPTGPPTAAWSPTSDNPKATGGPHAVVVTVTDGAGRPWTAQANVGDDPKVAAQYVKLTNAAGDEHPGLTAWFYADCVEVGVTRIDCPYDYLNCQLAVTYDGADMPHLPSSYSDGHVDFWLGCRMPPIRYGKQVGWDAAKIDKSLLPSYAWGESQVPYVDGVYADYTFNGLGCASTYGMGSGGERPDIGYMPQWNMGFLMNPSDTTWDIVRRADDHCGKWYSVYFSNPVTGDILDRTTVPDHTCFVPQAQVAAYPNNALVPYGGSYDGDTLIPPYSTADGRPKEVSACPNIPNGAHTTAYAVLSAMITETARDRDHASFWCNWGLFEMNPLTTLSDGLTSWATRQFAWGIRNIFLGAYVSAHTAYFNTELDHELDIVNRYVLPGNAFGTFGRSPEIRTIAGRGADGWNGIQSWMQYYVSMVLDAISFKRPEWLPLAKYVGKLPVLFFSRPYATAGAMSDILIHDPSGSFPASWDDVVRMGLIYYYRFTAEEADAMVKITTAKEAFDIVSAFYARIYAGTNYAWPGKYENGVCDLMGNTLSVDAHTVDFCAAVVAAANAGVPGSAEALDYIQNLPTKPDFTKNQKYHLVPRSV